MKAQSSDRLPDYKQQVASFYNARTNYDNAVTYDRAVHLFERTRLQSGQSVLDAATGTGNIAIKAAEIVGANGSVIGIDIATDLLKIAQQKIQAKQLTNIQLIEIDVEDYQAESNQFDAIYCSFAIVLFPNIPAVLANWYRFLKPGGFVAFTCSSENSYLAPAIVESCARNGVDLPNLHVPLGTPERCELVLGQAGFEQTSIHPRQLGTYLSVEQAQNRWNGRFWLHADNPLLALASEQIDRIKATYDRAIANLAIQDRVWHEELIYYVVASKPS